jgi:hypothetical protein
MFEILKYGFTTVHFLLNCSIPHYITQEHLLVGEGIVIQFPAGERVRVRCDFA